MGACVCDETMCGTSCVNLDTDEGNCGRCGNSCGRYERCRSGVCG
jgi:hypothetical protein